jgi:hypothetical protein
MHANFVSIRHTRVLSTPQHFRQRLLQVSNGVLTHGVELASPLPPLLLRLRAPAKVLEEVGGSPPHLETPVLAETNEAILQPHCKTTEPGMLAVVIRAVGRTEAHVVVLVFVVDLRTSAAAGTRLELGGVGVAVDARHVGCGGICGGICGGTCVVCC